MRAVDGSALGELMGALPAGLRVVAGGNAAAPYAVLDVLDGVLPTYRLFMLNAHHGIPAREGVVHETCFVGAGMRRSPTLSYMPARLSLVPRLFATTLPPDLVVVTVAPPVDGVFSLGAEVNVLPAAIAACKARGGLVVAQVNRCMPWTYGDGLLSADDIDYVLEADAALGSPPPTVLDDDARAVGERLAALVPDGATLQMGIGTVPDAALPGLASRRGLAVWSEMVSDGVLHLDQGGCLDPDAPLVSSFLYGSPDLYAWVHRNARVQVLRT